MVDDQKTVMMTLVVAFVYLLFVTHGTSLPTTMRAVVARGTADAGNFSQVEYVTNWPVPSFTSSQVLIQVNFSSVNPVDYKIIETGSVALGFPHVMGFDVAGTVVAVGASCKRLKVGDQVWADLGKYWVLRRGELGAWGEYAAADESQVGLMPSQLTFAEAGSLPLVSLTGYQAYKQMGSPWTGVYSNLTVVFYFTRFSCLVPFAHD